MGLKTKKIFNRFIVEDKFKNVKSVFYRWLLRLKLIWIDVKYSIEEKILLYTFKFRVKHTKKIRLYSLAYNQPQMSWDDVEVTDQWGLWLPLGFGIVSRKNWEFDQQINRDIGAPEEPWQDVVEGESWTTYYFKDDYLTHNHYIEAARKHFKKELGDIIYDKSIEIRLIVQSQKSLDDDLKQYIDWVAKGSPKMKIVFTDQAKEDMKRLFGEENANDILKRHENQEDSENK